LRVDTGDLDAAAAQLDRPRVVEEQHCGVEVEQGRPARERVAAVREVVIAENDERAPEPLEQVAQQSLAAGSREQIAADDDEVRLALDRPLDRALTRLPSASAHAEMQVR